MNIEELANSLKSWMQVDTWHTTHPLDSERFNKALSSTIDSHGLQITYDDFKDAMELLAEKLYSNKYEEKHLYDIIDKFASKAETIISYLYDTTET